MLNCFYEQNFSRNMRNIVNYLTCFLEFLNFTNCKENHQKRFCVKFFGMIQRGKGSHTTINCIF